MALRPRSSPKFPEEPLGVCEVLDEQAGGGSFGGIFGEETGEEVGEVGLLLAGDDEFLGRAAVDGGVVGGAGFAGRGGRSGLKMHRKPRFGLVSDPRVSGGARLRLVSDG